MDRGYFYRMEITSHLAVAINLILILPLSLAQPTLKLVSVLYRHGDRSPAAIYPLDKNNATAWPDGLGWLTNIGKQQQFVLGQFIKNKYSGFLNTSYYNHTEILVQSSGVNRCLMSAYCHLAGLYSPQGEQIWNPNLLWQPIPVQSTPTKSDNKLALGAPCPKYDKLLADVFNSPEIQKEEMENKDFYEMIEKNTGISKENVEDIWKVSDPLICEQAHNMTWNDWVYQSGVWEKLQSLTSLSYAVYLYTPEMARLKGGPLLKEIITNMQTATQQDKPSPKFYMYSAHDTTVATLLSAMHVFDRHAPIYNALVMVELHNIQSDYVVKIFYKNESNSDPYELFVPGCNLPCKLVDFVSLTKDTVPVDWNQECQLPVSQLPVSQKSADTTKCPNGGPTIFLSTWLILLTLWICA
ncbi:prostatic acid phosphatase-like isoform X3 [Biomphalaria glabrata]|uniref:acid phosphatase n=1 Tax=Biomphalaria glabrata TaxID=6526 RepID=A0A9W2YDW4_BIOGL|nr:prostatic acid phosphatase-like isoform X3 [Biomphalaria glabrata]